jgi:hypothetical protein
MVRGFGVAHFVKLHLLEHFPRLAILRGQDGLVAFEVPFDLLLGFGQETQAPGIADTSRPRCRWRANRRTRAD